MSQSFLKECREGVIARGLVATHDPVRSNAMLEAVELPAAVANLDAGLADVNTKALSHLWVVTACNVQTHIHY